MPLYARDQFWTGAFDWRPVAVWPVTGTDRKVSLFERQQATRCRPLPVLQSRGGYLSITATRPIVPSGTWPKDKLRARKSLALVNFGNRASLQLDDIQHVLLENMTINR